MRLLPPILLALSLAAPPALATSRSPHSAASSVAPADRPPEVPLDPTALSPEIREWIAHAVNRIGTDDERMRSVLTALEARHFVYDNGVTGTAAEVFETNRFNCLALAHLVVGIAREIGVDAYYLRIEEFRTYHQRGDLVLTSTHVSAGWGPAGRTQILEFDQATDRERRAAYRITDAEALALHYTNRGAEMLRTGRPGLARAWFDAALRIDEDTAEAWVNLGVAERRLGRLDRAEAAYRRAIELDPDDLSAWRNLASLLHLRGDPHAALELLELLDRPGYRNPYAFLALGDLCMEIGETEDAGRFYRRATVLDRRHPWILAARGEWALAAGDREEARKWLERALRRDAEEPRVVRLGIALRAEDPGSG